MGAQTVAHQRWVSKWKPSASVGAKGETAIAPKRISDTFASMIQKLRELLEAHPFRAFTVVLADGRRFDIVSPDTTKRCFGDKGVP